MNDAGKVAFTPRGTYSDSETYEYLDTVVYNGNAYAAKKITTGNAPSDPDNEYWALLAKGGESVPLATKERAGIVKLAFTETVYKNESYALDAVHTNPEVSGTLARRLFLQKAESDLKLSQENISQSNAVTDTGRYVLDAVEKKASVSGTLANQIATLNTKLGNWVDIKSVTATAGVDIHRALYNTITKEVIIDAYGDVPVGNGNPILQYVGHTPSAEIKYFFVEWVNGMVI